MRISEHKANYQVKNENEDINKQINNDEQHRRQIKEGRSKEKIKEKKTNFV
jgi:hypothetical protein